MRRDERGQALPLVVGLIAVVAAGIVALGTFAVGLLDRAAARNAADAAALAAVHDGRAGADAIAAANGARVVSFEGRDGEVRVTVRRARATATAQAVLTAP